MDVGTAKLTDGRAPRGRRTTSSTSSTSREEASVAATTAARCDIAIIHRRGGSRSCAAGPGSMCGRPSTGWRSRRPTRRCGRGWRPSSPTRASSPCASGSDARPGGRRRDPARQRPPIVRALEVSSSPDSRSPPRCRPGCTGSRRSSSASRPTGRSWTSGSTPRVRRMWGRRPGRRGGRARCARAAGGAHRVEGARLPSGARSGRRDDDRRRGPGGDRDGHPAVCAAPGVVVPRGPAVPGSRRRPRPGRPGLAAVGAGREDGPHDRPLPFTKGHGTENDFVLVPDLDGARPDHRRGPPRSPTGTPASVATASSASCRPRGRGADVAPAGRRAPWFMDYRNADGCLAEMCGNGIRVFAAYLLRARDCRAATSFADRHAGGRQASARRRRRVRRRPRPVARRRPRGGPERGFDSLVALPGRDRAPGPGSTSATRIPSSSCRRTSTSPRSDLTALPAVRPQAAARHQRRVGPGDRTGTHRDARARARRGARPAPCGTGAAAAVIATRCLGAARPTTGTTGSSTSPAAAVAVRRARAPGGARRAGRPRVSSMSRPASRADHSPDAVTRRPRKPFATATVLHASPSDSVAIAGSVVARRGSSGPRGTPTPPGASRRSQVAQQRRQRPALPTRIGGLDQMRSNRTSGRHLVGGPRGLADARGARRYRGELDGARVDVDRPDRRPRGEEPGVSAIGPQPQPRSRKVPSAGGAAPRRAGPGSPVDTCPARRPPARHDLDADARRGDRRRRVRSRPDRPVA